MKVLIVSLVLCGPVMFHSIVSRAESAFDADLGFESKSHLQSVAGFRSINFEAGELLTFKARLGLRLTHFLGADRKYQTANNRDRADNGIEFIKIEKSQHLSGNLSAGLESLYTPLEIGFGFGIDFLGYSFSPKVSFNGVDLDGNGLNALRWTYNDMGSLHSETYFVKYFDGSIWSVKIGTTHSVNQYRAKDDIAGVKTKRFLSFSDTIFVGLRSQIGSH